MIDVVLAFDVEDPINEDADESLLSLCRIHSEEDVAACLFVAGERARVLRERGRHDVIAAMREHEICYHGNYWADFPRPALQYGQELPWDEAVKYALGVELPGLHDVAEIMGQFPVAWCSHEAQQAAPLQQALKLAGVRCWAGGPRGWIMNWLSWPRSGCTISSQGTCQGPVDPTRREQLKPTCDPNADLAAIQERFDQLAETKDFISLVGHPALWVVAEGEWHEFSVLFRRGAPAGYPRPAHFTGSQPRSAEDRRAALELTRKLLRWLKSRNDVNLTTYARLCERDEEAPGQWLAMPQALDLARRMRQRLTYVSAFDASFSPADVLGLLTFACNHCWRYGRWPEQLPVQRLIGPTEAPFPNEGAVTLSRDCIFGGALAAYTIMMEERRVPGALRALRVDVGPGTWLHALTEFVTAAVETGEMPLEVTVQAMNDLPEAVNESAIRDRRFGSANRGPGLNDARLQEMLRWQSWSYRPVAGEIRT